MRRALTLIIVLSLLSFGAGFSLDILQRDTARAYLDGLSLVRSYIQEGRMDKARSEQAYWHARWQHDAHWLNALVTHHHTRTVEAAMARLSTALEMDWEKESLLALDDVIQSLSEVETSDFFHPENIF